MIEDQITTLLAKLKAVGNGKYLTYLENAELEILLKNILKNFIAIHLDLSQQAVLGFNLRKIVRENFPSDHEAIQNLFGRAYREAEAILGEGSEKAKALKAVIMAVVYSQYSRQQQRHSEATGLFPTRVAATDSADGKIDEASEVVAVDRRKPSHARRYAVADAIPAPEPSTTVAPASFPNSPQSVYQASLNKLLSHIYRIKITSGYRTELMTRLITLQREKTDEMPEETVEQRDEKKVARAYQLFSKRKSDGFPDRERGFFTAFIDSLIRESQEDHESNPSNKSRATLPGVLPDENVAESDGAPPSRDAGRTNRREFRVRMPRCSIPTPCFTVGRFLRANPAFTGETLIVLAWAFARLLAHFHFKSQLAAPVSDYAVSVVLSLYHLCFQVKRAQDLLYSLRIVLRPAGSRGDIVESSRKIKKIEAWKTSAYFLVAAGAGVGAWWALRGKQQANNNLFHMAIAAGAAPAFAFLDQVIFFVAAWCLVLRAVRKTAWRAGTDYGTGNNPAFSKK